MEISYVVLKDKEESRWYVGHFAFGYKIVKIKETWEDGAEVTLYTEGNKGVARFPMTSVLMIVYV
jgi:hypothetical protein